MKLMITCAGCHHGYDDSALFCPNCGQAKARDGVPDALIGKVLGERFLVQALLGEGGSGTIYRAEHVTLRRRVAIKVLHTELSRDDLAVERFRREATTVAEIDNEHIVEIHDFGRTPDGRLYLAMELLEGETLDQVLAREGQLSVERAADILIQVGEALMEAHAIGYVHRDLRPRNVYLAVRRGKANFVKLLDFGLAKLVEIEGQAASTSLGMTFGDPRYMSPEQARGDRIDRRADIYQLGCVAYEMLTGAPPFTGNRVFDILTKQVSEVPAPLPTRRPGVPLWMEAAVAKMLAKDPENRFATTTRMVEALRRGLDTGEVMEDEIARRRESVPPPSVSRVMQKMGLSGPQDPPPPAPLANPAATMMGSAPAPVLPPVAPSPAVASPPPAYTEAPARRSTGTPRLGVPVVQPEPLQPSVSGTIDPPVEPRGRARRVSQGASDSANISQSWYEDGDRASYGADADGAPVERSGRVRSPSTTDMSLYDEPRPRRWGAIIGVLVVLLVGGTVAFALTRSGGGSGDSAGPPPPVAVAIANPGPTVDAAPSVIIEPPADAAEPAAPPVEPPAPAKVVSTTGAASERRVARDTSSAKHAGEIMPADPGFRRPGGSMSPPGTSNPPPITTTPSPPKPLGPSGVDGPMDPYGASDTPSESASADRKAEFYSNVGAQQLNGGDTAGAAASFKKALEIDPRHAPAMIGMGEIALRQGLFGDAIAHLKQASRITKTARVFTLLGDAFLNSGNSREAAANFKKALQLDPDNVRARDGYNEASSRVPAGDE